MSTEIVPTEFQMLLKSFNDLVEKMPPAEKIKDQLLEIKELAINSHELNSRQREAITDRVKYYFSGEYGNTKTKENMSQGTPAK